MAVNFFNRLIVSGPRDQVLDFCTRAERTFERSVGDVGWTEHYPISFTALQKIAPIFPADEEIWDPYNISVWPVTSISPRRVEVRYQFETRTVDLSSALRRLSRKLPGLTFRLMILCLDDGDVDTWQMRAGKMRSRHVSDRRRERHWDAARRKFHLDGDEVYDDDDAMHFAEERMCAEALGSWQKRAGKPRRINWRRGEVFVKLEDERLIGLASLAAVLGPTKGQRASKRRVKHAGVRGSNSRTRSSSIKRG
jgi:hypothetical protein